MLGKHVPMVRHVVGEQDCNMRHLAPLHVEEGGRLPALMQTLEPPFPKPVASG